MWRAIALADPRIWRNIRLSSPDLTRLLLRRSEPLPLVASVPESCFGSSDKDPAEETTLLDQVLTRTRAINLEVQTGDALAWLETQPAPLLEELSITRVGSGTGMQKLAIHELFAGDHPRLRALELHGCYLPWHRGLYHGLTRLALSGPLLAQAPCADVLAALASCPALEALSLQFASVAGYLGVMRHDGAVAPRARVHLPCLNSLALRLPFYDMRYFLAGLALAAPLRAAHIAYPSGELLLGLAHVRAALPRHTFPALRALRVARTAPASFALDGAGIAPGGEEYEVHVEAHVQGLLRDCATLLRALAEDGMPALRQVDVVDEALGPEDLANVVGAVGLFQHAPSLVVNGAMCVVAQHDIKVTVVPQQCL
ncbi:hypothetical protein PsYK624_040700 [Phanerochaete sordida]|uniref:Uncharacterized protein n=1 Tax=Phanerochaete sordida TaxID=48140 RepID=A0A9P3LBM4_9APHY|nr:hypothetical protein PsYK624_040700 [Phanerochaete sordida]